MPTNRIAFLVFLVLLAFGCSKSKRNQCNTIRTKASIEMKATETIATQLSNPQALAGHVELLKTTAEELSKLEIEDPNLKNAALDYCKALRGLASGYQKATAGLKAQGQGDLEKAADENLGAGAEMVVYGTMLNASRKRIAEICSKP